MISTTTQELEALCLHLNPRKLHLSGRPPTGAIPTKFSLNGVEIQALDDGTPYAYLGNPLGGCGIPSAAEDSDFYLVDSAFKLLTSKDQRVQLEALGQLTRTVRHRIARDPTDGDLAEFMSGSMEGEYSDTTNEYSNHWTLARRASVRQNVAWSFVDGSPSVSIGDETLTRTKRRGIMKAFHDHFQLNETQNLLAAPSQGKVMDCVAMAPTSAHFITSGKYTRFADWRFIHKARLNLVPLNANKKGPLPALRACRKCGEWDETLPHVLNHCKSYSAAWQLRHNAILARIKTAIAFKGTILSENQVVGPNRLRPDLVAQVDGKIYIIDVTIPFENRRQAFSQARERKKLATNRYLKVLRQLCVSDCIRWSRDIYIQHLTGAKQYSTDAPLHPPPRYTQERRSRQRDEPTSIPRAVVTPGLPNAILPTTNATSDDTTVPLTGETENTLPPPDGDVVRPSAVSMNTEQEQLPNCELENATADSMPLTDTQPTNNANSFENHHDLIQKPNLHTIGVTSPNNDVTSEPTEVPHAVEG
ncbi:retrovirus-related Pol polyprotein from type-1 retrotransposable element R2 [Trichonephila clavipes]|nr:retrovirus-related Pol polyprotein from type-1 retrotransposable element R2 [Trichonephila clavipes]